MQDEEKTRAQLTRELQELRLRISVIERTEEQLEAEKARYKGLFDNISSGVAVYRALENGEDFILIDFNKAGERIDEVKREDIIGNRVTEAFPGIREFGLLDVFRRVWRRGQAEHFPLARYRDERIAGWRDNYIYKLPSGEIVAVYDDVTEAKHSQDALSASEEMYKTLVLASPDAIVVTDLDGNITHASPRSLKLYGCEKEEELLGRSAFDLIAPEEHEKAASHLEKTLTEEFSGSVDYRLFRKDGSTYIGEMKVALIKDAHAEPKAFIAIIRDITERRRTEEALRESEEKYRIIVENALEGIWAIDAEANTTFVNQRMADMLGYTVDEMMGEHLFSFMDERGREIAEKNIERRRQGIAEQHDFEFICKDGTRIYTLLEAGPLEDEDGNYTGALAFITNITERKLSLDRQEKLSLLFQNLGPDFLENMEAIIETGRDALNGGQMSYCRMDRGRLFCVISTDPEEPLTVNREPEGHICNKVIAELKNAPLAIEDLEKTPFRDTDPYVKKHGMKSVLAYPVSMQEQTIGSLSLFSKEKRAFTSEEISIIATLANTLGIEEERLEREEALKDFIDIASHELRHPVTIIKGYAISLRDLWEKLDDDSRKEMLDAMDKGADRINRLALELLDVSRIERGSFIVKKEEVGLQHLAEEILAEIGNIGREYTISLSIPEEIPVLYIDPERISEVIYILMDNAMAYSPTGSEIEVKAAMGESEVLISVTDRGIGIPEDHRGRIFERFGQVEDALHHSTPGMGMGLYIAKEIVEAHGGRIWHEPRECGGSIFRFSLPL